jgi:hypothetical protein
LFTVDADPNDISSNNVPTLNVASSSNATLVIVAFVVDLEQDPKFPKAIVKKQKYEFGCKFQDVWVIRLPWAKSMVMAMGKSPLLGAKFVLKLKAKKSP